MEIIIKEVEFDILHRLSKIFNIEEQIAVKKYLEEKGIDPEYNVLPYVVEENIIDLEKVLNECEKWDNGKSDLSKLAEWNEFSYFYKVMLNISHKRYVGRQVDDIEYIYEVLKYDQRIKLLPAINFDFDTKYVDKTLYVESKGIQVFLYQMIGGWDLTLSVNYKDNNITHWHPRWPKHAIEDLKTILEGKLYLIIKTTMFIKRKKYQILLPKFYEYDRKLRKVKDHKKYQVISF